MKNDIIAHFDPKSTASEAFRALRTNLQFTQVAKKTKTILVTSSSPSEGKSFVTANLAVVFAQTGKRVLLIDADLRKARQHKIFGLTNTRGLSNYLSGMMEDETGDESEDAARGLAGYIKKTGVANLHLFTSGNVPPNPAELLESARMKVLLEKLRDYYDIIVLDGTPVMYVTDSVILSALVDSVIIVASFKDTKIEILEKTKKSLESVGAKIAGVVLNRMNEQAIYYNQHRYYIRQSEEQKKGF